MKRIFLVLLLVLMSAACKQSNTLYSDIPTEIAVIAAHSHSDSTYHPVPDSLQLRYNRLLRLLRINVVTQGCGPSPEARLTIEGERIIVQFDMKNSCIHVQPEWFDVDLSLSPVHLESFQLIVEEKSFTMDEPGTILLNRRVQVEDLPGL